jgi:hypothetical protein
VREQCNVGIAKVRAAGENAAEENGGIDGRNFRIPNALTGIDIGVVKEKSAMVRELVVQEAQSFENARSCIGAGDESALFADTERGQTKTCGGDAGYNGIIGAGFARIAAIFDQASVWTGLLPKKATGKALDFVQELIVFGGEGRGRQRRSGCRRAGGLSEDRQCVANGSQQRSSPESEKIAS